MRAFNTVLKRVEKLRGEGYIIPEHAIPKKRKHINKQALSHLKSFTEKKIQETRGVKYETENGEIVSGKEGRKIQYRQRYQKGRVKIKRGEAYIQGIIQQIEMSRNLAEQIGTTSAQQIVQRADYLEQVLGWYDAYDHDELVERLSKHEGSYLVERTQTALKYPQDNEAEFAYVELQNIIRGRAMTMEEIQEEYYE